MLGVIIKYYLEIFDIIFKNKIRSFSCCNCLSTTESSLLENLKRELIFQAWFRFTSAILYNSISQSDNDRRN